jgi:hypothetical protein
MDGLVRLFVSSGERRAVPHTPLPCFLFYFFFKKVLYMIVSNPNDYKLKGFEKSKTKNKKYDAILIHKQTGREKRVPFGDNRYSHYKDTTGLGIYSKADTLDKERRRLYRLRHAGEDKNKYSSGWFSWFFLW